MPSCAALMPTPRMIHNAEVGGEPLSSNEKMARFILPVLLLLIAQARGEFRWCAHCLRLTPDVDLHRCGGCKQVGYYVRAMPGQKPCHKAHWKAGHTQECAQFAAEAKAAAAAVDAAEAAAAEAAKPGAAGGGGGGGKKKKGRRKD